jgi:hypothetical protein
VNYNARWTRYTITITAVLFGVSFIAGLTGILYNDPGFKLAATVILAAALIGAAAATRMAWPAIRVDALHWSQASTEDRKVTAGNIRAEIDTVFGPRWFKRLVVFLYLRFLNRIAHRVARDHGWHHR